MKMPQVTVLMPVFNGEKYLKEAIESILNQDFTDFEFLIINDGSTDNSAEIICSYKDSRIVLITNEKNIGLVSTLNKGIELAKGEYIVRMDCDDISLKNRVSKQVAFMDRNKDIAVSGSFYNLFRNNKKAVVDLPLTKQEIKCFLVFNSPIAHPTAIIRKNAIQQFKLNYSSEYIHAEDYDFWSQIANHYELANIPDVLLDYRVHMNQITGNLHLVSKKNSSVTAIRLRHLQQNGILPSEDELLLHNSISNGETLENIEQVKNSENWLKKLINNNNEKKNLDKYFFEKIILERWLRLCFNFFGAKKGLYYFINSALFKTIKLPLNRKKELLKSFYNSWKRKKQLKFNQP